MGQILLVFNPIVSVVFTATAFLTQKAMQLFGCFKIFKRQTIYFLRKCTDA